LLAAVNTHTNGINVFENTQTQSHIRCVKCCLGFSWVHKVTQKSSRWSICSCCSKNSLILYRLNAVLDIQRTLYKAVSWFSEWNTYLPPS